MTILVALALLGAQAEQPAALHVPEGDAVREMHRAASCIAREQTGQAHAVLAMDFRTEAYRRRLQQLARSNRQCFDRWLGMSGMAFAGGLAEHLFLGDHDATDPAHLAALRPPEARNRSEALSYCVVRRNPVEARAVLGTPVASEAEGAALEALRPALAECLQGTEEAHLNRPGLRSLLALAFYHLSRVRMTAAAGEPGSAD